MSEYMVKHFVIDRKHPLGAFMVQKVDDAQEHLMKIDYLRSGALYWDYELLAYVIDCDDRYVTNPWS